ncbi:hypothetical protein [Gordonia sp. 852002-50395_SCH5434458]|uniref:hypothetical protein n=1 Tax=Gordonia sp. 852002-50395_SCH5434458 TaxID=1834090 RepID=UPI0018D41EDF|nr:hypothetical protein [Gordonia sp. 852002-50395_SCH5434458]
MNANDTTPETNTAAASTETGNTASTGRPSRVTARPSQSALRPSSQDSESPAHWPPPESARHTRAPCP